MGRTQLAKTKIEELRKRIEASEKHKKKIISYLQNSKDRVLDKRITYSDYQVLANKKLDGKTPKEWINYYDNYANSCQKLIDKENRKIIKNKTILAFLFLLGFSILIFALFYATPNIIGLIVQEEKQEFTQELDLEFTDSTVYEWQLNNPGILDSVKISGFIEGDGKVKVYLDNFLILDSNDLQEKKAKKGVTGQAISVEESTGIKDFFRKIFGLFGIAGRAVDESGETSSDTSAEAEESNSEESETPPEDSSPSQEESASDEESNNDKVISEEETIDELNEETTKEAE